MEKKKLKINKNIVEKSFVFKRCQFQGHDVFTNKKPSRAKHVLYDVHKNQANRHQNGCYERQLTLNHLNHFDFPEISRHLSVAASTAPMTALRKLHFSR